MIISCVLPWALAAFTLLSCNFLKGTSNEVEALLSNIEYLSSRIYISISPESVLSEQCFLLLQRGYRVSDARYIFLVLPQGCAFESGVSGTNSSVSPHEHCLTAAKTIDAACRGQPISNGRAYQGRHSSYGR